MKRYCPENFETTINRWYIDTRPYVPQPHNPKSLHTLPLLSTLKRTDQEAVTRFIRPADRFMSLASALLKYTFIHRRAKIPWSDVQVSRTPAPHRRPYWEPPEDWSTTDIYDESDPIYGEPCRIRGLEFNVSHQAGLVTIIGCSTPTAQLPSAIRSNPGPVSPTVLDSLAHIDLNSHPTCTAFDDRNIIRLGVDIACTNEDKRTPKDLTTQAKFDEWIEIFAEMFSDRERIHMRQTPVHVPVKEREEGEWSDSDPSSTASSPRDSKGDNSSVFSEHEAKMIKLKLRRFYAYWGLKEAYIKMVGEGLLASWLRELEFLDVHAPPPPPPLPQQRDPRTPSATLDTRPGRNSSSATQAILENQTTPLPASADIYAHRKSIGANTPPSTATVGGMSTIPIPTTADDAKGMMHTRGHSGATLPPLETNGATAHRRTSSIPAADMYAQHRHPSMSSPTPTDASHNPRKLSFPAASSLTHGAAYVRPHPHEYLSPFPDSPATPSLLDPPPDSLPGAEHHPEPTETAKWTAPDKAERGMTTLFKGKRVEDVKIELVAYDQDFMIATAIRGVNERAVPGDAGTFGEGSGWWLRLDFDKDIRPCAEGWCTCLER
jgi:4'-phosphopantetheinyl transferase